jgi:hypothetical protein
MAREWFEVRARLMAREWFDVRARLMAREWFDVRARVMAREWFRVSDREPLFPCCPYTASSLSARQGSAPVAFAEYVSTATRAASGISPSDSGELSPFPTEELRAGDEMMKARQNHA